MRRKVEAGNLHIVSSCLPVPGRLGHLLEASREGHAQSLQPRCSAASFGKHQ